MKHWHHDDPPKRVPELVALHAAISDMIALLDQLETVDDEATHAVVRAWIKTSRLKGLWQLE